MLTRCLLVIPLLLAACASPPKPVGKDTVDPSYTAGGGKFENGGPVIIAAAARDFGGQMAICAIRINDFEGTLQKRAIESVLEAGRIEVNGDVVLRNFRRLPLTRSKTDVSGSQADCFTTDTTWTNDPKEIEIIIPQYRDRSSNTEQIHFRRQPVDFEIKPEAPTAPAVDPEPKDGQWQRSSS